MMKIYKTADGFMRQFEEGTQPADAVLVETKAKEEIKNKAVQPKNKAKKAAKK